MIYPTGRSILAFHYWRFMPGSVSQLMHDDGRIVATIHSPEIGTHLWTEARAVFSNLHDAQRAVEKSVKK